MLELYSLECGHVVSRPSAGSAVSGMANGTLPHGCFTLRWSVTGLSLSTAFKGPMCMEVSASLCTLALDWRRCCFACFLNCRHLETCCGHGISQAHGFWLTMYMTHLCVSLIMLPSNAADWRRQACCAGICDVCGWMRKARASCRRADCPHGTAVPSELNSVAQSVTQSSALLTYGLQIGRLLVTSQGNGVSRANDHCLHWSLLCLRRAD